MTKSWLRPSEKDTHISTHTSLQHIFPVSLFTAQLPSQLLLSPSLSQQEGSAWGGGGGGMRVERTVEYFPNRHDDLTPYHLQSCLAVATVTWSCSISAPLDELDWADKREWSQSSVSFPWKQLVDGTADHTQGRGLEDGKTRHAGNAVGVTPERCLETAACQYNR